ncbi:MAG TPA: hypothetical protein VL282_15730 [Tepidisphaeraceae bacterium]|jgi:hypothetical protein|nr:hypothetical protein [Tepidisphaeraceae bacterium]
MSESAQEASNDVVQSPPVASAPQRDDTSEVRGRLHRLAIELMRSRNRRLLIEYLQLRRAVR